MAELTEEQRRWLGRMGRGAVASIPFVGAFLEQVSFGPREDKKAAELRKIIGSLAKAQRESDATVEEILQSVRSEASPGSELSAKLDEILALIPQRAEPPGRTPVPTVFISSTIEDLGDHREKAKDAANRAEFLPVLSQYFPASQHKRALDLCLERAAQADVLVAIVGHRYGFVPPDNDKKDEKSITWLECEAAGPDTKVLAFLVDPAFRGLDATKEQQRLMDALAKGDDITALAVEVQRNIRKLEEFRRWVSSDEKKFLCKTFTNPDNLALEVYHALAGWRRRNTRFAATLAPAERPPADPTQYLQWLSNHTGFINIRGLQVGKGKAHRFPIEELYITLTTAAERPAEKRGESRRSKEDLSELVAEREAASVPLQSALRSDRLVIVGDPGSGKTTFLHRICYALAQTLLEEEPQAAKERLGIDDKPFPIFVRIGELAEHIRLCHEDPARPGPVSANAPTWLPNFLATRSQEMSWGLDEDFFRKTIESGRAIILLDGLDEAPGRVERESIVRMFEHATAAYGPCRFVVTTRPRAYEGVAVLDGFRRAEIEPLTPEAIDTFLQHWCEGLYQGGADAERHRGQLTEALRSRPEIRRMASNPVMLTALAVVHWNENRLPEQRAELYESVLRWLLRAHEQKPGKASSEVCARRFRKLALEMQNHPGGRQVQVTKHWAAEAIEDTFAAPTHEERIERAETFLDEEEIDSGVITSVGRKVRFWHLTFQEYLAARAVAGLGEEKQLELLFEGERLYQPEWREVLELFGGVLHEQGRDKVDAFVKAVLARLGEEPTLADRARCIGLLGAMVRDLSPLEYEPGDPAYRATLEAVMDIFDAEKSEGVPFQDRLDAAEALGQAGDPRLDEDDWVTIPAGTFRMGSKDGDDDKTPVHEVELDGFQIGRYPVTVQELARFVGEGGYQERRWWKDPERFGKYEAPHEWVMRSTRHARTTLTRTHQGARRRWACTRVGRAWKGCTTWPVMCGSGARTGMTLATMRNRRGATRQGRRAAGLALCAPAAGAAIGAMRAPPSATAAIRATAAASSVFGWCVRPPSLNAEALATGPLYSGPRKARLCGAKPLESFLGEALVGQAGRSSRCRGDGVTRVRTGRVNLVTASHFSHGNGSVGC